MCKSCEPDPVSPLVSFSLCPGAPNGLSEIGFEVFRDMIARGRFPSAVVRLSNDEAQELENEIRAAEFFASRSPSAGQTAEPSFFRKVMNNRCAGGCGRQAVSNGWCGHRLCDGAPAVVSSDCPL